MNKKIRKYRTNPFFPFGMFSLVFMPILFLNELDNRNIFRETGYLTIQWWNLDVSQSNKELLPNKDHPNREYTKIHLTGNDKQDKIKLDFVQLEIRDLKQTHSLKKGIHVFFDDTAKYWTFVKIFNICAIEKMNYFVPNNNSVWIYFLDTTKALDPNTKRYFRSFCGNSSLNGDVVPLVLQDLQILKQFLNYSNTMDFQSIKKYFLHIYSLNATTYQNQIKRLQNRSYPS
jgi:hypothetical protein